ncbi:MAG TPA: thioredoxin domain-containing protein [Bacteroidota bacterium]|nr:thioredoxin domain-containing protein [Bacteroidota bacterium]
MKAKKSNRLIGEKSPYLLQHAHNPVDWYPWGDEAFEKAQREDKPIFLSIGYSTCYWCHVMEREVFENDSIAELMNEHVVSIKVDREERPDVDRIYMAALQAMTGSGGWPMSMFLTPDRKPFFGGTYIPPKAKYGRAGFEDVLSRIHEVWATQRNEILESGEQIAEHLRSFLAPPASPTSAGRQALDLGFQSFLRSFDRVNGGFGGAPKFPTPVSFNFLLRYFHRTGERRALEITLATLKNMFNGGMYDHLGGGFHRYSTDARWHVPHFEKMLYDQAQIAVAYLEAYQITQETFHADVVRNILKYVEREMTDPEGGFYSAEDAESALDPKDPSRKKEGASYTWTNVEIDSLLTSHEGELFGYIFDVQPAGNVLEDPQGEFRGLNVLHRVHTAEEAAAHFKIMSDDVIKTTNRAREKLLLAREDRPYPHRDDKILLSWNGLMISTFARASQILDEPEYLRIAKRASEFILERMIDTKRGIFLRRYRDGEARFDGHLEDYSFFIQALIDLYEASFEIRWLKEAMELTKKMNSVFYDSNDGGFFDTAGLDTTLIARTKESTDGAEPSGNSIAILNLLRLSQMTDDKEYAQMAEKSLRYFGERILAIPAACAQFLVALDFSLVKPKQIIIAGPANRADTRAMHREVQSHFLPAKILLLADGNAGQELLSSSVPFLKSITMIDGKATAYVCENYACRLPTSNVHELGQQLSGPRD